MAQGPMYREQTAEESANPPIKISIKFHTIIFPEESTFSMDVPQKLFEARVTPRKNTLMQNTN